MSLAFLDLIELEPSLQSTFGWCAVVGLLGLLLARWKWWSALVTVPFAILCSMRWELLALGREVVHRRAAGPDALFTYFSEGMVLVLIALGIVWNRVRTQNEMTLSWERPRCNDESATALRSERV